MDMMMAKLQEWTGRVQPVKGRLAETLSAALDACCMALAALESRAAFSPQAAAAILAGLQAVQETARIGKQMGDGCWEYQLERFSPAGSILTFRRDPPHLMEAGFQLDNENRLHGIFYIQPGESETGQESTFGLKQSPEGWALVKWQDDQEIQYPLAAPERVTLWNPAPKVDLWDHLVPTGGLALSSWQTSPGVIPAPEKPLREIPEPTEPVDSSPAATMIRAKLDASPSIILVFEKGGKQATVTGRLKIGRDRDNDLAIEDIEISRYHAVIELAANGWQIRDLNSSNGTWLNGTRISGTATLQPGDKVRFGKTHLKVESQT